jgi:hypothetical protein
MWRGLGAPGATGGAILSLFLMHLGAPVVSAQDVVALRPPSLVGGEGVRDDDGVRSRVDEARPERSARGPVLDHRSILLDLTSLRLPPGEEVRSLVSEIAPEVDAPGSVIRSYHGFQGVFQRHLMGYYHQAVSEYLHQIWAGGSLTPAELEERACTIFYYEVDHSTGGRWWDRTWRQSLTAEKGGASALPRVENVGSEIELFHLGEVAVTTEGKVRIGRLGVYVEDDRVYERVKSSLEPIATPQAKARTEPHAARGVQTGAPPPETTPTKPKPLPLPTDEARIDLRVAMDDDAEIELQRTLRGTMRERFLRSYRNGSTSTPRGNLWTGDGWSVSVRPFLHLRVPQMSSPDTTVGSAGAQLDVTLFRADTRDAWAVVMLRVQGRPHQNEVTSTLDFELVRW